MKTLVIAAPFVASLVTMLFYPLHTRRSVRIVLAVVAAAMPLLLIGHADGLSLLFVAIVSLLSLLATVFSTGTFSFDWGAGNVLWSRKSVYFVLLGAFWSAMLVVVLADNFVLLWLGISATTLATAFLVGFSGELASLEAAWKYLLLCSVGIAVALLGIVILAHITYALGLDGRALMWSQIAQLKVTSAPPLAAVATGLMLVGFATKAGLVPMHAWLPDAHSKAPAPISALLSGVLVSCALYAIMRVESVADALRVSASFHLVLLFFGAASVVIAGVLMLVQQDLKRLLAYSTVEHAGLVALALGFGGPLGQFAALFHVVSHACTKCAAFLAAGMVQREKGTTTLAELHGLWESGPGGRLLLGAVTALSGMPPFGLFISELLLVLAGIAAHQWIALGFGMVGVVLAFTALARTALEIEGGRASGTPRVLTADSRAMDGAALAQIGIRLEPGLIQRAAHPVSRLSFGATSLALAGAFIIALSPWTHWGEALQSIATSIVRYQ